MTTKTALVVLGAIASAAVVGCSDNSGSPGEGTDASVRASLHRSADCNGLLSDLKADALYKLNQTINQQIADIRACQKAYGDAQCAFAYGGGGVTRNAELGAAPATPTTASDSAGSSSSSSFGSASSYSQTNVQVAGVDEADFVKNDGTNIYVIHGNTFKVIKAWPATELKEAGSIVIEGTPNEMFVANGKVVVYSQVNGDQIFQKAGVTPKTSYRDYGWVAQADGMAAPTTATGSTRYAPLAKITILTLDGSTPRVTGEQYFEGNYLDARRVDNHVRSVFQSYQYGPALKYGVWDLEPNTTWTSGSQVIAALGRLRDTNKAAIAASQLGDWLPYTFVKNGEQVSAQTTSCSDFYIPNVGSTESGMTKISSLDLNDPTGAPKETAILGQADTVYANGNTMYLAARAWTAMPFAWIAPGVAVSGGTAVSSPPSAGSSDGTASTKSLHMLTTTTTGADGIVTYSNGDTHLHKFDFTADPSFPNYVASGTVAGNIKDQFSLDEKDQSLRIATTESRTYVKPDGSMIFNDATHPTTTNHVFVLSQNGPWLDTVGNVGDLAPGESIYSVRFVGRRGYVTTFRQVDPLFVIDLAQPRSPSVLGSLKIDGFSEYMQPIDDTHLLTIGRNADAQGRTQSLQLQIFDVSDATHPNRTQVFTYDGTEYGSSDAEYDHHAFTWFPEKGLLAFPYYAYGNGVNGGFHSSLEVFHVDTKTGFSKIGSVDSTPLITQYPQGWYCGYYAPSVRRGVFLENFVYSVSYGGIAVKDTANFAAPGAQLSLPQPTYNGGYGPQKDCAFAAD